MGLSKLFFSLTVFGRSLLLIVLLLLVNAVCWGVAAGWHTLLGLSMLAWTIGLRHALDADHISAIDNATRTLISHGQLAVTCGFYFSLGHSTIVVAANLAIVISTSVYNKLSTFNNLASVIGTAISASFLFLVGLGNSIILWRITRQRPVRRLLSVSEVKHREDQDATMNSDPPIRNTLMMRVIGPLVNFVNRPWKMYPVGVLFGLGFDTASSIALLALSALAQRNSGGNGIRPSQVLVLPMLFTSGMTLVDSLNSIMMLYSYSGFAEHSWKILERTTPANEVEDGGTVCDADVHVNGKFDQTWPEWITHSAQQHVGASADVIAGVSTGAEEGDRDVAREKDLVARTRRQTLSNLSILLTSMSILLAFSIAIIEVMGLIGQECARCQQAASAADGGGLAGKWWRAWQRANDNSGYIGAAMAGAFLLVVIGWFGVK
ncbi:NicO-domain-containing protein, partial [Pisolithus albus]